jgi:hypothetical protein
MTVSPGLVNDLDPGVQQCPVSGQAEAGADIHILIIEEIFLIEALYSSKQRTGK